MAYEAEDYEKRREALHLSLTVYLAHVECGEMPTGIKTVTDRARIYYNFLTETLPAPKVAYSPDCAVETITVRDFEVVPKEKIWLDVQDNVDVYINGARVWNS